MENLLIISGLVAPLVFIVGTFLLAKNLPNFDFKTKQLSHLGGVGSTCKKFHLYFLMFGVLEGAFIVLLISKYHLLSKPYILLPIIISFLMIAIVPFFPSNKHWMIHHVLAIVGFGSSFVFSINLASLISSFNFKVAFFMILLTIGVFLVYANRFFRRKTCFAIDEYVYFFGMFIWNILHISVLI